MTKHLPESQKPNNSRKAPISVPAVDHAGYNSRLLLKKCYPMRHLLVTTICACLLAACGLKGPLFLPEADSETAQQEREQASPQQPRGRIKGAEESLPPAIN